MTQLHPQFLTKNEKPEFVVLPYEEFVDLQERLEDLEDLVDLRNAKNEEENEPPSWLADVKKELGISQLNILLEWQLYKASVAGGCH